MSDDSKRPERKTELGDFGPELMRKMDEFFQSKPANNILGSIDSFFQNSVSAPVRIPVDMFETEKEWVVKVDLPGVDKSNIDVDVAGDQLKIRITNDEDIKKFDDNHKFYQRERRVRQAERTVKLPYAIDKRTAKAKFANGVLDIRGPKKPRSDYNLDID